MPRCLHEYTARALCTNEEFAKKVWSALRTAEDTSDFYTWIKDSVWELSHSSQSTSKIVQLFIKKSQQTQQVAIAEELRTHINDAWQFDLAKHANHVLQECIVEIPPQSLDFVFMEMAGLAEEAAKNQYGCRVLQRLIEHSSQTQVGQGLVNEIIKSTLELARHQWGKYVMQGILDNGTDDHRNSIAEKLCIPPALLSSQISNEHFSIVLNKALRLCAVHARQRLVDAIFECDAMLRRNGDKSGNNKCGLHQRYYASYVMRLIKRNQRSGRSDSGWFCSKASESPFSELHAEASRPGESPQADKRSAANALAAVDISFQPDNLEVDNGIAASKCVANGGGPKGKGGTGEQNKKGGRRAQAGK